MYIHRKTDYLKRLVVGEKRIYRISEIALLWGMNSAHSLRMTVSRYERRQLLYRLTRGVYSLVPADKLSPWEIGCAVMGPLSYISCETVLSQSGIINQPVRQITLLGKKRKELSFNGQIYVCRYLHPRFLVNRAGIRRHLNYDMAETVRAVADQLHILPHYHLDGMKLVDPQELVRLQTEIGYL